MASPEFVYMGSFWPTPKEPARVTVELVVKPQVDDKVWTFRAEVRFPGETRVKAGELLATHKVDADAEATQELVVLLSEILADVTAHLERR